MPNFVSSVDTVLVIGATSGIGKALALKFHGEGKNVIISGRRQENLDEITSQLKNERISSVQWDLTDLGSIKSTFDGIVKKHGDTLNAVLIVSGIQRTTDFTKPESLDFDEISLEITTNYTAYIHIIAACFPFLSKVKDPWLGVVSSSLALVPMIRTPNYNGTKAALHQLILTMRAQLQGANSPIHIIEIYPPAVKTELHDKKHQPDLKDDYPGMELDDFTAEVWEGLTAGRNDIAVGSGREQWEKVDRPRQELFAATLKK